MKIIEKGLIIDIGNENLFLEKGIIQLTLNNFSDALVNLNEALSINPKLSSVKFLNNKCIFRK